ncbi:MAG: ATP-dependent zinc protease [Rhodospirillaceae bacterium]
MTPAKQKNKKPAPGRKRAASARQRTVIGWREWVGLPDLGIDQIKVKVDTGARTSALHAFRISPFTKDGAAYVKFYVHPVQKRSRPEIECTALVMDRRAVTDSGGKATERYVIRTSLWLGDARWPIELTLTNRDEMGFRMLLGRQAIRRKFVVDPAKSFTARKG